MVLLAFASYFCNFMEFLFSNTS